MASELRRIEVVIAPSFLTGCDSWSIDLLREKRLEAENLEESISYARRVVQGRIDVLEEYLRQSQDGTSSDSLTQVKNAISARLDAASSRIAHNDISPDSLIPSWEEISEVVGAEIDVAPATSEEIKAALQELRSAEEKVSAYRKRLHGVIDALRSELVTRYKAGDMNIDALLDQADVPDSSGTQSN